MRHTPCQCRPITPPMLSDMCHACDVLHSPLGKTLKFAILCGFLGFLRQSNLAPRKAGSFDPTRNTCRGDIIVQKPGQCLLVIIKWTKTIQTMDSSVLLPIPTLPGSHMDPLAAFKDMVTAVPTKAANDPLLMIPSASGGHHTMSIDTLRQCFKQLLITIGADHTAFSLHSLRRGGSTLSHRMGVSLLDIQRHGGWKSNAFLDYITRVEPQNSAVASALQTALL